MAVVAGRACTAGGVALATASRATSSLLPRRTISADSISASICGSAGLARQVVPSFCTEV